MANPKSKAQYLDLLDNPPSPIIVNVNPPAVNVTVHPASVNVQVGAGGLDEFKDGTILMDGTEQILLQYNQLARIMGYLDLGNMEAGDTVIIRQYLRLKPEGDFRKYADQTYSGVQTVPIVYLTPKESDYGMKITVEQQSGTFKSFDYNFIREK